MNFATFSPSLTLNIVRKCRFFFITFVDSEQVLENFSSGSWKSLCFLSVKEWEPWLLSLLLNACVTGVLWCQPSVHTVGVCRLFECQLCLC